MLRICLVGCGAIGSGVLGLVSGDAGIVVDSIVVTPGSREAAGRVAPGARLVDRIDEIGSGVDLMVECAGHSAIEAHVLPALQRGIACIVTSVGALAEPGLRDRLVDAAEAAGTQLQLVSGAIGGIDALAAARLGGLDSVAYTGRKPPLAWRGTPAESACDLASLAEPLMIFEGSARDAARLYPKNANVAATLSLAGLGLDATSVRLWADPGVSDNVHHVDARGTFGSFELTLRGRPLAANPKTSALTVYSVVRAINNRAHALSI